MEPTEKRYDLTEGIIWKKLALFFLPVLAGNLFQQLYITADAIIIGRFAGKDALASIDAIYSLLKLPINFFTGLSAGAAIIISHYAGAGDNGKLSRAAHTAVAFAFSGALVLSAAGILLLPVCIYLLKVPDDIKDYALSYGRIYFAGMAVSMTYNIGAGILRAMGNSKTPFYFLIAANAANVILDMIFVGLFQWHTTGAALATVLSQLLSAVLVIAALTRSHLPCRIVWKNIRVHRVEMRRIILLGLPMGIQSCLYPVANMMIQSNINAFGINSIAAWAICGKLDLLIWLVVDSLGSTISTFTAQNFGARLYDRVWTGVRVCTCMSVFFVFVISTVLYLGCGFLGRLFVSDDEVLELCVSLMRFLVPFYFLYIGGEICSGAIRGMGETFKPMILTLLGTCAFRIVWILFAVPLRPTLRMVIWSYPVSWFITSLAFVVFFRIYKMRLYQNQLTAR
jgi:putative MATE family efflux protein